ncbi:MAG: IS30 family transposase [Culicoidibacterales bacterium]
MERGQIKAYLDTGYTRYAIAKKLGRSFNTIKYEIMRGTVKQIKAGKEVHVYFPDSGQLQYEKNRLKCRKPYKLFSCYPFIQAVTTAFKVNHHAFDVTCGTAKVHKLYAPAQMVCAKTLYNYVDLGLLTIKNIDLPFKIPRNQKQTHTRKHVKNLGKSITDRPKHIQTRTEFGHWEIDTVIGEKTNQDEVLITLTERKTRAELIYKVAGKTSIAVDQCLAQLHLELGTTNFNHVFKTITADNGSEFASLTQLETYTATKVYFAHPYASWERGTNERHNGIIRRFLPKGTRMSDISHEQVAHIQNCCNTLPRKILGYDSPRERLQQELELLVYSIIF